MLLVTWKTGCMLYGYNKLQKYTIQSVKINKFQAKIKGPSFFKYTSDKWSLWPIMIAWNRVHQYKSPETGVTCQLYNSLTGSRNVHKPHKLNWNYAKIDSKQIQWEKFLWTFCPGSWLVRIWGEMFLTPIKLSWQDCVL